MKTKFNKKTLAIILAAIFALTLFTATACQNTPSELGTPTEAPTEEPRENWDDVAKVIIMCGQSNMEGSSLVSEVTNDMCPGFRKGYSNIKIMYNVGGREQSPSLWNSSKGELKKVRVGQGATSNYFGPELGLAQYLSEKYPNDTFYLVKHALGGAPIADYLGVSPFGNDCFKETRNQFNLAVEEIRKETNKEIKVVAICWMQGESDAMSASLAPIYGSQLSKVANAFREEYKDYAPANGIAFIDAGISDSSTWTYYTDINDAKIAFAATSDDNYYIDTIAAKLPIGPDNMHYTGEGEVKLGQLFGEYIAKCMG